MTLLFLRLIYTVQLLPTTIACNLHVIYFSRHLHACNFWPYNTKETGFKDIICIYFGFASFGSSCAYQLTFFLQCYKNTSNCCCSCIFIHLVTALAIIKNWLFVPEVCKFSVSSELNTAFFVSFFVSATMLQKTYITGLPTRVILLQKHQNCI